jgi:hypothetical protein
MNGRFKVDGLYAMEEELFQGIVCALLSRVFGIH